MVNNSPPLLVHLQSVLQMLLTKIFHENLSAPIAVTPKNIDFDGDYLALKDFFINEICVLRNEVTVFSPIKGHSKRWTPLISGQFFFQRPNSGQSLIKRTALIKGHYLLHKIVNLAFFFSPISGHSKIFRN